MSLPAPGSPAAPPAKLLVDVLGRSPGNCAPLMEMPLSADAGPGMLSDASRAPAIATAALEDVAYRRRESIIAPARRRWWWELISRDLPHCSPERALKGESGSRPTTGYRTQDRRTRTIAAEMHNPLRLR